MKEMADTLIKRINDLATPVKIMHVCGSHEHTIMDLQIFLMIVKMKKVLEMMRLQRIKKII